VGFIPLNLYGFGVKKIILELFGPCKAG